MNTSVKGLVAAGAAFGLMSAAASCGGGDSTGPNSTRDINGTWTISANYNHAASQTTCNLNGTLTIAQSGTTFTGQVSNSDASCSNPSGTTAGSGDGPIAGGQINGNSVNYSDGECAYTGTITGNPANRVAGNTNCNVAISGTTYVFTGTWQMSR
jgi:hypothetical protein